MRNFVDLNFIKCLVIFCFFTRNFDASNSFEILKFQTNPNGEFCQPLDCECKCKTPPTITQCNSTVPLTTTTQPEPTTTTTQPEPTTTTTQPEPTTTTTLKPPPITTTPSTTSTNTTTSQITRRTFAPFTFPSISYRSTNGPTYLPPATTEKIKTTTTTKSRGPNDPIPAPRFNFSYSFPSFSPVPSRRARQNPEIATTTEGYYKYREEDQNLRKILFEQEGKLEENLLPPF